MSNAQQTKSRWGVGALLQQAVSGVESRLDTILANDDEPSKLSGQKADDATSKSTLTAVKPAAGGKLRLPSQFAVALTNIDIVKQLPGPPPLLGKMIACKSVWRGLWLNRRARRCPVAPDRPLMCPLVRRPRYKAPRRAPVWTARELA
jgi:hypothetical protein